VKPRALQQILRESTATLDSIAEECRKPANIRIKAKEFKITFVRAPRSVGSRNVF
jgi:hypothetical protein